MVERHDRVVVGEVVGEVGEVLLPTTESVDQHQPGAGSLHVDRQADAVVSHDAHATIVVQPGLGRQTGCLHT